MFTVLDKKYQNRLYLHGEYEVQFRKGLAENVPPAVAYRMARNSNDLEVSGGPMPYNPDAWKKERRVIWACNYAAANGYGMVAENVVASLLRLGVNVGNPKSVSGDMVMGGELVDEIVRQTVDRPIIPDCIEVQHCQPPALVGGVVERIWTYTMFETDHTPRRWIDLLNTVERVIVPSSWLVDSWKKQGLKKPISVYGHGVDPRYYSYLERPERDTFTFLHYAQLSIRKGTDVLYRAFADEFTKEDDVKLILKNTYPVFPVPMGHPKIEYIAVTYSKEQMRQLLARADCAVFPSRGEGFGLTPLEAMATGLPTIVTNWSGPADYIDRSDTLALNHSMARSYDFDDIYKAFWEPGEHSGNWAEPSYEHLRHLMRWAYEHRKEAKEMGRRAAQRVARDWTWETKTREFMGLLDRHA